MYMYLCYLPEFLDFINVSLFSSLEANIVQLKFLSHQKRENVRMIKRQLSVESVNSEDSKKRKTEENSHSAGETVEVSKNAECSKKQSTLKRKKKCADRNKNQTEDLPRKITEGPRGQTEVNEISDDLRG